MEIDRVEEWKQFSEYMEKYIQEKTVGKYGVQNSGNSKNSVDLMAITSDSRVCIWNILKYALRSWNGKMKAHDLEKMAHYASMAWCISFKNTEKN